MTDPHSPQSLQLKTLLRDVHPAVWRRVRLSDAMCIADLHRVIQLLMGWDDDHLHRFRIHGQDYGIAYVGGLSFDDDAASVPLSRFQFCPTERFIYEYDFSAGWQVEVRVEQILSASRRDPPICVAGREPGAPDGLWRTTGVRGTTPRCVRLGDGRWPMIWMRSSQSYAGSASAIQRSWTIRTNARTSSARCHG